MKFNRTLIFLFLIGADQLSGSKQPFKLPPIKEETIDLGSLGLPKAPKKRGLDPASLDALAEAMPELRAEQAAPKRPKSAQINLRITHETLQDVLARCTDHPDLGLAMQANKIIITNQQTREQIIYLGHSAPIYKITKNGATNSERVQAFSPDEKYLITSSDDKTVRIWDIETQSARVLKGFVSCVTALAINNDSTMLITGCADGTLVVWDLIKNRKHTVSCHYDSAITGIEFKDGGDQFIQFAVEIAGHANALISCIIEKKKPGNLYPWYHGGEYTQAEFEAAQNILKGEKFNDPSEFDYLREIIQRFVSIADIARADKKHKMGQHDLRIGQHDPRTVESYRATEPSQKLTKFERLKRVCGITAPIVYRIIHIDYKEKLKWLDLCYERLEDKKRLAERDEWARYRDICDTLDAIQEIFLMDWFSEHALRSIDDTLRFTKDYISSPALIAQLAHKIKAVQDVCRQTREQYYQAQQKKEEERRRQESERLAAIELLEKTNREAVLPKKVAAGDRGVSPVESERLQKSLKDSKTPDKTNSQPMDRSPGIGLRESGDALESAKNKVTQCLIKLRDLKRWQGRTDFGRAWDVECALRSIEQQFFVERNTEKAIESIRYVVKIWSERPKLAAENMLGIQKLLVAITQTINSEKQVLDEQISTICVQVEQAVTDAETKFEELVQHVDNAGSASQDESQAHVYAAMMALDEVVNLLCMIEQFNAEHTNRFGGQLKKVEELSELGKKMIEELRSEKSHQVNRTVKAETK